MEKLNHSDNQRILRFMKSKMYVREDIELRVYQYGCVRCVFYDKDGNEYIHTVGRSVK